VAAVRVIPAFADDLRAMSEAPILRTGARTCRYQMAVHDETAVCLAGLAEGHLFDFGLAGHLQAPHLHRRRAELMEAFSHALIYGSSGKYAIDVIYFVCSLCPHERCPSYSRLAKREQDSSLAAR
jgi:hypothetical protein